MSAALIFIALVFVVIAIAFGFGRGGFRARDAALQRQGALPGCGQCGYPARGITTIHCPECGADLREVGIAKPGQGQGQGTLAVVLLVYSIAFMILCGIFSEVVESVLPSYGTASTHLTLTPTHSTYNAQVQLEISETIWGHSHSSSLSFNFRSSSHGGTAPSQISLTGLTPEMEMDHLSVELDLNAVAPGATFRPALQIDPATGVATWHGLDGKTKQSSGPFSDQDMLRFLGAAGLDETQAQTITDAQQLHLFLDGLIHRKTQFAIIGFDSYSSGSGASYGGGPAWVWPLYTLVCILLWVIGLILIARRFRGRTTTRTKLE